jgi:hypothetical protein
LDEHDKAVKQAKAGWLTSGKWDGGKTPRTEGRQLLRKDTWPSGWY